MKRCVIVLSVLCVFLQHNIFAQKKSKESSEVKNFKVVKWKPDTTLISKLDTDYIMFKGGLVLSGKGLHGLSSLVTLDSGKSFFTISDHAFEGKCIKWYHYDILNKEGFLDTISLRESGKVGGLNKSLTDKGIESIAVIDDLAYISFDSTGEIFKYKLYSDGEGKLFRICFKKRHKGVEIKSLPDIENGGFEAMTETQNRELLAIYEKAKEGDKYRKAWLINPKTKSGLDKPLKYSNKLDDVKGATTLQNGDVVVLEKTFYPADKVSHVMLRLIDKDDIDKTKIKPSKTLLDVKSNELDNFEGITSYIDNGKEYLLLISDDNENHEQKTLLLKFELNLNKKM